MACLSSFHNFSFLWRTRLAPFQSSNPLAISVRGTKWTDGVAETFSWYSQNWPTVLLLLPRAGLSLAILLLYGTTAYGGATAAGGTESGRDSAYFVQGSGNLTGFAIGILLA